MLAYGSSPPATEWPGYSSVEEARVLAALPRTSISELEALSSHFGRYGYLPGMVSRATGSRSTASPLKGQMSLFTT